MLATAPPSCVRGIKCQTCAFCILQVKIQKYKDTDALFNCLLTTVNLYVIFSEELFELNRILLCYLSNQNIESNSTMLFFWPFGIQFKACYIFLWCKRSCFTMMKLHVTISEEISKSNARLLC